LRDELDTLVGALSGTYASDTFFGEAFAYATAASDTLSWVLDEGDWGPLVPDKEVSDPSGYFHALRELYRLEHPADAAGTPDGP